LIIGVDNIESLIFWESFGSYSSSALSS